MFKGKKITLMGLGLLGRGIGDAEFLAEEGAELIVTDLKNEAELAPSIARLARFPNITYHLGGHRLEDFEGCDFVLRAPNAPLDSPYLAHARNKNIPVEMDASLFAKHSPATIVGITGTRGKSTVTHLIYETLKSGGKNVFLGGNERDTATLPLIRKVTAGDIVVLELDSWQLQGFEESRISPNVSIWTNFMPDHMNYYKGDMERYFQDKAAIARFQKAGDTFIAPKDIKDRIEARFGPLSAQCITDPALPHDSELGIAGEHNKKNAALAYAAARALGISDEIIRDTFKKFKGLPGRMEFLGEKSGIAFYNDSNATTPDATLAALAALSPQKRPIILIAGGSDKELDLSKLAPAIEATKHAVLFTGKATEKLQGLFSKDFMFDTASNMDEAVKKALAAASAGDIILLSPGATSFGIFKNEYDRGDQFRALIARL